MREGPGVWELTPELVRQLASEYPAEYDEASAFEYFLRGLEGYLHQDKDKLRLQLLPRW
jgi:hypothetical protein